MEKPVEEGQVFMNVKIESVGTKGDGAFTIKGFVVFVPNTRLDEIVDVRITKVFEKFAFGVVEPRVGVSF